MPHVIDQFTILIHISEIVELHLLDNYGSMVSFNKIYIVKYFNYVNFVIILITIIAYYLHAKSFFDFIIFFISSIEYFFYIFC